jgi:hypothetical protein
MNDNVTLNYVINAYNELEKYFWLKEPINWTDIIHLIKKWKINDAIKLIWLQLGFIDINIKLEYVSDNYFKRINIWNWSHWAAAQIIIPNNLPYYWTKELNDYCFDVKINKDIVKKPISFIAVISHELSHIILHSLKYKDMQSEIHTDITAIIFWFLNIYKLWRKNINETSKINPFFLLLWVIITETTKNTTTYAYLSDYNLCYIETQINNKISYFKNNVYNLKNKLKIYNKLIKYLILNLWILKESLDYLIKNPLKEIWLKDYRILSKFLQNWYLDDLNFFKNNIDSEYVNIKNKLFSIEYSNKYEAELLIIKNKIVNNEEIVNKKLLIIKIDLKFLINKISFPIRLKIIAKNYILFYSKNVKRIILNIIRH